MHEENIFKMSEKADREIKDVPILNILICYLLSKIGKPVEAEQLYEISVGTGIINYFYYQDSIDYLLKNELIQSEIKENKEYYSLLPKGTICGEKLRNYAPKAYRDKLELAAVKYFAKLKINQEIKVEYIELENGYYVHIRCLDVRYDLMDMKLFAPDLTQAELIGNKIMLNPAGFYGKIIGIALSNEEDKYELDRN